MRGGRFRPKAHTDSPNLRRPAESRRRGRSPSPSNRPNHEDRRCAPTAGLSPSARMTLGNLGKTARFTRRPEQTSRRALTAQGDLEGMEQTKQASGSGHKQPIGRSPASVRKKVDRKKAESVRPLRKETGSKSKSEKLVCRYCGSDDLAPSFIKRRDRRCRKCFSKRYGSAAPERKAKLKN